MRICTKAYVNKVVTVMVITILEAKDWIYFCYYNAELNVHAFIVFISLNFIVAEMVDVLHVAVYSVHNCFVRWS